MDNPLLGYMSSLITIVVIVALTTTCFLEADSLFGSLTILAGGTFSIWHLFRIRIHSERLIRREGVLLVLKGDAGHLRRIFQHEVDAQQRCVSPHSRPEDEKRLQECRKYSRDAKKRWNNLIRAAHFFGFEETSSYKRYWEEAED